MINHALRVSFIVALLLSACLCSRSALAGWDIEPTRVVLPLGASNGTLTVANAENAPARFKVQPFAWAQRPDGEIELTPTSDLTLSPAEATLGPHEAVNIHITTKAGQPLETEKTYRLMIEELPIPDLPPSAGSKVYSNVGVPVFLRPAFVSNGGKVDMAGLRKGMLSFSVQNAGNTYFLVEAVNVVGMDAKDRPVFDVGREGWYVLAGGRRDFQIKLSGKDCRRAERFMIRVKLENDAFETLFPRQAAECGAGAKTEFPRSPSGW